MKQRLPLKGLPAAMTWLRDAFRIPPAPSVTSLSQSRKLTPIEDVVARAGREQFLPD